MAKNNQKRKFNGKVYTSARSSRKAPDGVFSIKDGKEAAAFWKDSGANVRIVPVGTTKRKVRVYYRLNRR